MTDSIQVVKNPLSPVEHPGGLGVNCELFELGVEQFVVSLYGSASVTDRVNTNLTLCRPRPFRIDYSFLLPS